MYISNIHTNYHKKRKLRLTCNIDEHVFYTGKHKLGIPVSKFGMVIWRELNRYLL